MLTRKLLNLFALTCLLAVQVAAVPMQSAASAEPLQAVPNMALVSPPLRNHPVGVLAPGAVTAPAAPFTAVIAASPVITLTTTGFDPPLLTVDAGTEVTWYNATGQTHIVQSGEPHAVYLPLILRQAGGDSASGPEEGLPLAAPLGDEEFGGMLLPGGTFTHTFTSVGEFPYYLVTDLRFRGRVVVTTGLPPDPAEVAPPLDRTVATTLHAATEFLYTGEHPIQTGVAPGTIEPVRVAVLRGRVLDRDDNPLPGVRITILNHPEFGQTLSREDGMFDMAVNGGGVLTVKYEKDGLLPAQRQVDAPWQDYMWAPEAVLIPLDTQVTAIDLTEPTEMQVAQGSVVTDDNGIRQATLLFPPNTQAKMTFPEGSAVAQAALSTMNVRLTEYTVGENGPEAMPAELPPNVGYTYAVEFSADEAMAAGATDVQFDQPLTFYVEDYIGFPVGGAVPTGYYDKAAGQWVASDNGRVVEVLSITAGLADLDTDGDGVADNGVVITPTMVLTITIAERQKLAELYPQPPQALWRVPVEHFTPYDCNWPYGCEDEDEDGKPDCEPPPEPEPEWDDLNDEVCEDEGNSVIECQNQILGERVPLVGTPLSLSYRSDRVPGRRAARVLKIPVTGNKVPSSLLRIDLSVQVAGQYTGTTLYGWTPNQVHTFEWNGLDDYERPVQGRQRVRVCLGYTYQLAYRGLVPGGGGFGGSGGGSIAVSIPELEITLWRCWRGTVGAWDARAQALGGWNLDVHHAYDFYGRMLYLGDGRRRSTDSIRPVIRTVAGGGSASPPDWGDGGLATEAQLGGPHKVTVAADGSLYIADKELCRVRRVGPDGIITTVAGTTCGFSGDGGPATEAQLGLTLGVALAPDGSLYIADYSNSRVRRVGPDGIITTVAGGGEAGFPDYGDGGPATEALLPAVRAVAVAPDGSLYLAHYNLIRRVGPDGIIWTAAGTGTTTCLGDGGLATQAGNHTPSGLAVGPDGSLYIADQGCDRVRRIGTDGIISTTVGTGTTGFGGDGGPATAALLYNPSDVTVAPDGSLLVADSGNYRVRRVGPDGIISTVAGGGLAGAPDYGDGGPATGARLVDPIGLTVAPDGSLLVADRSFDRVRQVYSPLSGFDGTDLAIPSEDGSELYQFSATGRHLRTRHALTGATLYEFGYDDGGRLVTVTDGDGNVTTIERAGEGVPTAVVGPYGQRTELALHGNGYLAEITNPAGETHAFSYTDDGLLTDRTDPRGYDYHYTYDDMGRLVRADDPAGGFKELDRTRIEDGYQVALTTAEGRTTTYAVQQLPSGEKRLVNTFPCGTQTETLID